MTAYKMRISDWSSDVCSSGLWKACAPAIFIWNTPAIFELAARGSNARRDRFANFLRCKGDALARTIYEFLLTIDAAQKTRAIAECGIDRTIWRLDRIITRHSRSAGYTRTHWRAARHPHCARRRHAAGNRCSARHPRSTRRPRRSWCGISLALRHFIANAGKPLIEHALHIGLRDRRCRNERIALRRNRRRKKNGANHSRQGQSRGDRKSTRLNSSH